MKTTLPKRLLLSVLTIIICLVLLECNATVYRLSKGLGFSRAELIQERETYPDSQVMRTLLLHVPH